MIILFPNSPFSKEFFGCIDHISSYLPTLEYAQWVSASPLGLKILGSGPDDVLGWVLGPNLIKMLSVTSVSVQWPKFRFETAKWMIKNGKQWFGIHIPFFHKNFLQIILSVDLVLGSEIFSPDIEECVFLNSISPAWWCDNHSCSK